MNKNAQGKFRRQLAGLRELAEILVRDDNIEGACSFLAACKDQNPPRDNGASFLLIEMMKRCSSKEQARRIGWLMDEFCPRVSSMTMKALLRNRVQMHSRCMDQDGWNRIIEAIPRLEKAGKFKPPLKIFEPASPSHRPL